MLAGFFFMCFTAAGSAGDRVPPESDSVIIADHLRKDIYKMGSEDSALTEQQLDSMLWADEGLRIAETSIQWSPDSAFRICTIRLEFCGGYCNSDWMSWLHFNDGSGVVISETGFGEITKIRLMRDGKYLILGAFYGRSGTFSCREDAAYLFSIDDHKLVYHKIPDPLENTAYGQQSFSVSFCTYMSTQSTLKYDEAKRELRYSCGEDTGPMVIPDSVTVYNGVLTYTDSSFVITKNKKRRIKYIAPE